MFKSFKRWIANYSNKCFLIDKSQTMTVKGGMTDYYLSDECKGRLTFAEEYKKHTQMLLL